MMIIRNEGPTERALSNESVGVDETLAPLSPPEAAHLIRLAEAAAAERGLSAAYDGRGALVLESGLVAGLTNLARIVFAHRRQVWPQLVGAHFDQLATGLRQGPPPPPADPARELYLRLVPTQALPPGWGGDAPEFVPGLLAVPATRGDGVVSMHLQPESFGLSWAQATEYGLANLRRLADTVEHAEYGGARVAVLSGSSFTASRALVLETVLRESLHVERPAHGVLVAMPVRDLLLVHVITDDSVVAALCLMLSATARSYAEEPGPLDPWVYLVADDGWHRATEHVHGEQAGGERLDGGFPVRLSPRMLALARELEPLVPRPDD